MKEIILKANKIIEKIVSLLHLEIDKLDNTSWEAQNSKATIDSLISVKKTLYYKRQMEKLKTKRDRVNYYIDRRYNNFAEDTTKMINSVLNRRTEAVDYQQIKMQTGIITKPEEILETTRKHFLCWTKYNPIDENSWKAWENYYKPIKG
ncbi:13694_t:CDS:1, partial [Gigaspora rosea]